MHKMSIKRRRITKDVPCTRDGKVATWFQEFKRYPEATLYRKSGEEEENSLSTISEVEREFIWNWCENRHLDDVFAVVAMTYWVRARADVAINFLFNDNNKRVYMVLCIHLALKWLGYDEENKCDFFKDLVELVGKHFLRPVEHQRMEVDLLKALKWEM